MFTIINKIMRNAITILVIALFFSCENDLKEIESITELSNQPQQIGKNVEILYSDSGLVQVKLIAPLLYHYEHSEEPYVEFPAGIKMIFYDDSLKEESTLTANYSIYYEKKGIWEAKYDVIAKNKQEETLNTEYLIWDQNLGKISSDKFVKITDEESIIYGDGLEANQDLTNWKIMNPKGIINIGDQNK